MEHHGDTRFIHKATLWARAVSLQDDAGRGRVDATKFLIPATEKPAADHVMRGRQRGAAMFGDDRVDPYFVFSRSGEARKMEQQGDEGDRGEDAGCLRAVKDASR